MRREKIITFVGVTILLVIVFSFIFVIYLFGITGMFKLLGVQYDSISSLVLFVIGFLIIATIAELIYSPISELILKNETKKFNAILISFFIQALGNGICLFMMDAFMSSITISLKAGLIVVVLITLIEMVIEKSDPNNTSKRLKMLN